jgi:hypothetical protein
MNLPIKTKREFYEQLCEKLYEAETKLKRLEQTPGYVLPWAKVVEDIAFIYEEISEKPPEGFAEILREARVMQTLRLMVNNLD